MKEITILFLEGKYPINSFIEQYINFRGRPIDNLHSKYRFRNTLIIPIQIIADNYLEYVIEWCKTEFNITEVYNDKNEIIKYI